MKNKSPAFQFYPDDWLGSKAIALMKPSHEGGYIRLLCYQWNDPTCTLPNNIEQLTVLSRLGAEFKPAWKYLKQVFVPFSKNKKRVYNIRLYEEMLKQQRHREEMAAAGKRGALARWGQEAGTKDDMARPYSEDGLTMASPSDDNGKAMPRPMAKHGSSSPSSSPSSSNKTTKGAPRGQISSFFLASQFRVYISKTISAEKCQQEFEDALKRGVGAGGLNAAIECQWKPGMKVWDWLKAFEKEHRKKETRPKIFRASDDPEQKPLPPEIKKMLAEATAKLTLHPKENPNADQPKPDEKPS